MHRPPTLRPQHGDSCVGNHQGLAVSQMAAVRPRWRPRIHSCAMGYVSGGGWGVDVRRGSPLATAGSLWLGQPRTPTPVPSHPNLPASPTYTYTSVPSLPATPLHAPLAVLRSDGLDRPVFKAEFLMIEFVKGVFYLFFLKGNRSKTDAFCDIFFERNVQQCFDYTSECQCR